MGSTVADEVIVGDKSSEGRTAGLKTSERERPMKSSDTGRNSKLGAVGEEVVKYRL
jgi:hypothetical protein